MQRRDFTKSVLAASGGLMLGGLSSCTTSNTPLEREMPNNWIWIRPNLEWTDDQWKQSFDTIKSIGIDAIVPQVYNSHYTLFDHPILPVKERWLERILPLAHQADLEVHAWMWSMPLNVPEMIEKHPDWFSVNRQGKPSHTDPAYVDYYKFLCPCHPEVQEFVAGNVEALAKIEDLDGIHLDYIRQPDVILAEGLQPKYDIVQDKEYPEYDYPYSDRCRNTFKEISGIDPFDLGDDAPAHKEWRQFRYDAISNIVNNFAVPRAKKYGKKITAAVFPNWESVRQEWQTWDLDGFLPMLYHGFYNEDIAWIGEQVAKNKKLLVEDKPIYAGLFLPHLEPEELILAYNSAMENGANGISLFGFGNLNENFQNKLKQILVK
jgi:uncharacterized lipoprotein YddW (UPF0748 family)